MISAINAGGTSVGILADSLLKASVSIKYRDGIRQGRLVLVSPYDPSAGFNAGNAMNRNKFIYALADHALIVDSAYEKGGTWAGAKEELKRENHPPVWVRLDGKVSAGNEQLLKLGARAFPSEPWNQHILKLLEDLQDLKTIHEDKKESWQLDLLKSQDWQPSNPSEEPIHTQPVPEVAQLPQTAYDAVIPLLLYHLREPKGEKEIADVLDVGLGQARLWLKKAVQDSSIEKKKTKYLLNQSPQQLQLLK
jgi:predicted Rossmann fold nucleotide-binding protein DprA/Smf involved in DNA uptake